MSTFTPTREQRAILDRRGPLLVLAGAGVGKTAVLTQRVANAIERDGAAPESILALTFTRAAAEEMRARIAQVLDDRGSQANPNAIWVGTYHAFAGEIVREFGVRIGVTPAVRLLGDADKWELLDRIFDGLDFEAVPVRNAGTAFDQILKFVSDAQNHLITPEEIEVYADRASDGETGEQAAELLAQWHEMAAAYRAYQDAKLEAGAVDFGDQITYALRLLDEHADVRAELRRRHSHVFVDEYQDTNPAQRQLLLSLIGRDNPNLFVIGDDDQAIFRFQGATVSNILSLPEEASLGDARPAVQTLVGNRRSLPPILDVANAVADRIAGRRPKRLTHLLDGRATIGACVADTDRDEARWIAERIASLRNASTGSELRTFGAYAVLCRRRALMRPVAEALAAARIPFRNADPTPLLERWEIDEIRAMLQILATPEDDVALARILISPRWQVSDADLWALTGRRRAALEADGGGGARPSRAGTLLDAVMRFEDLDGLSAAGRERLGRFRDELLALDRRSRTATVGELVGAVIAAGGYRAELSASEHEDDIEGLRSLDRFERLAVEFGASPGLRGLRAFVQYLDRADEAGDPSFGDNERPAPDPESVSLTTVHRAKGLEWPVVFVPGLAAGRFPSKSRSKQDNVARAPYPLRAERAGLPAFDAGAFGYDDAFEAEQERRDAALADLELNDERRLLYVAITRARTHLYLTRAHWYETKKKPSEPSVFWGNLTDSELCQDLGEAPASASNPALVGRPGAAIDTPDDRGFAAAGIERRIAHGEAEAVIDELLGSNDRADWESTRAEADRLIERVTSRTPVPKRAGPVVEVPITSYSALSTFEICERRYRHAYIDRLPRRPSPSRAAGAALHRAVAGESLLAGDPDAPDASDLPGDVEAALAGHEHWLATYRASRFASRQAEVVEHPFALTLEAGVIRGTIDRIDRLPDGSIEIVDFKTGRPPADEKLSADLQLPIYALAAGELHDLAPDGIRASFFFVEDGSEWPLRWDQASAGDARSRLERLLARLRGGDYPLTDDQRQCRHCDFKHICGR